MPVLIIALVYTFIIFPGAPYFTVFLKPGVEEMKIFRCELCPKPCTITTLDEKSPTLCPVTGEAAEWNQVNGRASRKMPLVAGAGEEALS